jgi:hypothetical protein
MRHILYGQLWLENWQDLYPHEDLFFIKFETCGLGTLAESREHLSNFLRPKENGGVQRKEHTIRPGKKSFVSIFDSLKIVKEIAESFKAFASAASLDILEFHNIRLMYLKAQAAYSHSSKTVRDCAIAFTSKVDAVYSNGHNDVRCGDEVIIDLAPFFDMSDFRK